MTKHAYSIIETQLMIKPTRITVDQATREVLDQLSTQLAQAPAWTTTLHDSIQDGFRDGTRQSQTATNRLLEPLVAASRALQGQLVEQAASLARLFDIVRAVEARINAQEQGMPDVVRQLLQDAERRQRDHQNEQARILTTVLTSVKALEPRVVTQQEDLRKLLGLEEQTRTALTKYHAMLEAVQHLMQDVDRHQRGSQAEQIQALAALSTSVQTLEPRVVAQQETLGAQRQELMNLLSSEEQTRAAVTKHHAMLEAMQHLIQDAERHQHNRQTEQAKVQAASHSLLHEIQAEQTRQQSDLRLISQRLEALSEPWWKKFFKGNRSQNS